ncbi:hypothetical protein [Streptomyces nitrosporeus]|uniref:hypothetical protein n=1 Tax=Streptomyces nitrosporeus TaxID=28894 RepID=UPI0039A3E30C
MMRTPLCAGEQPEPHGRPAVLNLLTATIAGTSTPLVLDIDTRAATILVVIVIVILLARRPAGRSPAGACGS